MGRVTSFFQGELSSVSRVMIVIATLTLLPSIFLPTWNITLHAPQYPEGLTLVIYPHTVGGQLDEVNLLNHYIGMREITPNEFPEFRLIPFFILRFFAFAVLAALVARIPIAAIGYLDFVMFGVVMLYTFQHWLTEFGTQLSPAAPIDLAPFVPRFIGTTHVAQFSVSSMPAAGGILMGIAGLMGPVVLIYEWRRRFGSRTPAPST
ncbi:MAG: hypothetical protein Q8W45_02135 [Candidatus Palauibacterales bacterium]|nr:hypothetical protein [Candidatus Palauibacterales bacterium]MDP2482054.1 hypothetical protein [Candidatus Palauibacterales bacterium]